MQFYRIINRKQGNANRNGSIGARDLSLASRIGDQPGQWQGLPPVSVALLSLLIIALGLLGSFWFTVQASGHDEPTQIEIAGAVVTAPASPDGIGNWQVRTTNATLYTVVAAANTEFKDGKIPQQNQPVKLRGKLEGDHLIAAERIEVLASEEGNEVTLKGILLSAPVGGTGAWLIQNTAALTYTLIANNATRLDDGTPAPGAWIEVRGQWQPDGTLLATRIRLDNHAVNQVIVRLAEGVISETWASNYQLIPLQTLLASGNIHLFKTGEDQERSIVEALNHNDTKVIWAELNYVGGIPEGHGYKTWHWGGDDPSGYVNQNAFAQVNLTSQSADQGAGVVIAVLDTGVDLTHPALKDHLLSGRDMVSDDGIAQDEEGGLGWGHGTHVAGIIAKVAPQSMIIPVRVLDSDGRGNIFTLAYAIEWAVNQGADVINLSLGAESNSRVLQDTIQKALDQGVVVVAAAGNTSTDAPQFPASYRGVIAVTAVDGDNRKADFANYGAAWVDIAAPGVGITSTMIGPLGSGYASWSGTSMSTGFVSGAIALVRQALPNASPAEITAQLIRHNRNLDELNPTYTGKLGGLLDVGATLADTPTPAPSPTPPNPTGDTQKVYLPLTRR